MFKKFVSALLCSALLVQNAEIPILALEPLPAQESDSVSSVHQGKIGTADWSIDSNGVLTIGPGVFENDDPVFEWPWIPYADEITAVEGTSRFIPTGTIEYAFSSLPKVKRIDLNGWDTSNVNDMDMLFAYNPSLDSIHIPDWNTSNVTIMTGMFQDCPSLVHLDLSTWDMHNVQYANLMFSGCESLSDIAVDAWNTSGMVNMSYMFEGCQNLVSLDVSAWDTSSVREMVQMFMDCQSLETLDVSQWNTGNVTAMESIFSGCTSLRLLEIEDWDVSNLETLSCMFQGCSSLETLDLSKWNTSNITYMSYAFSGCSNLTSLSIAYWMTSSVEEMVYMFENCTSLQTLDVGLWNISNVSIMRGMFSGCSSLADLDVSSWDTSNVTDMRWLFSDCSSLESLDVGNWSTNRLYMAEGIFQGCSSLVSLDVENWNTENLTNFGWMFDGCSSLTSLDLALWNTGSAVNMDEMFKDCQKLADLNLRLWNTAKVCSMNGMFYGASSLASLDLGSWDTGNVEDMRVMFAGCTSLRSIDIASWNTSNVRDAWEIFSDLPMLYSIQYSRTSQNLLQELPRDTAWYQDDQGPFDVWKIPELTGDNPVLLVRADKEPSTGGHLAYAEISGIQDEYEETGYQVCPKPVVLLNGIRLVENTDYEVSYTDNILQGTATIWISGIGNYTGSTSRIFSIVARDGQKKIQMAGGESMPILSIYLPDTSLFSSTKTYNNDKAVASLLLAHAIYSYTEESAYPEQTSLERIQKELGLADADHTVSRFYKENKPNPGTGEKYRSPNHLFTIYADPVTGRNIVSVIVQGSTTSGDWLLDFTPGGFESAAVRIHSQLISYLKENGLKPSDAYFFVTGHSLGGAVADLINMHLIQDSKVNPDRIECYTFAAPLTKRGTSYSYSNAHNVVLNQDIVPQVTPDVIYTCVGGIADALDQQSNDFCHYGSDAVFTMNHPVEKYYSLYGKYPDKEDPDGILGQFAFAHACTTYMSILYKNEYVGQSPYRSLAIMCPVNVEIYDENNTRVASVINDRVTNAKEDTILINSSNSHKLILLPNSQEYTLKLTGTNNGKMNIRLLHPQNNGSYSAFSFNNVALAGKKKFELQSTSSSANDQKSLFVTDADNHKISQVDKNGKETPLTVRVTMHRLYNPNSGEHFYTAAENEKNFLAKNGWKYEGTGWIAPDKSKTPVYRLYNKNAGDHHYTMNASEKDFLVKSGWTYEGIGWYSDDAKGVPLYRQYNPNAKAGSHNYTPNKKENDFLVQNGWKAEGISWYGLK